MAQSIFEKTMAACLESKRTSKVATSKKVTESVKRQKRLRENEELLDDPMATDVVADDPEVEMDDISDDIVVVIDPEVDEIPEVADDAQDIIDNTDEGDIPFTDEYLGDRTYTCPICGNTFFSDREMSSGDECPVCGDTPEDFVLVGEIAETEEVATEEEVIDDVTDELEPALDVEDEIIDVEEPAEEEDALAIDESTFNPFMNKFIRENYRNAKSFVITGARLRGKTLTLECKLTFKTGKAKAVKLTVENFRPAKKSVLAVRDNGLFKTESAKAPLYFAVSMNKNVIRCEGLKYNFVTKAVKEGKKVRISGNLLRESARRK